MNRQRGGWSGGVGMEVGGQIERICKEGKIKDKNRGGRGEGRHTSHGEM